MSRANLQIYYHNELHSLKICSEYVLDICTKSKSGYLSAVILDVANTLEKQYQKQLDIISGILAITGFDDIEDTSHVMEGITISKEFMLESSHDKDTDDVVLIKAAGCRCNYFRHSFINCAAIARELGLLDHHNIFKSLCNEHDFFINEFNQLAIDYIYPKAARVSTAI